MGIRVFVSPDPTVPFGDSWEYVGALDTGAPSINQQAAKKLQSIPGGGGVRIAFYLYGDPSSRWVGSKREHGSFGIAFDLLGDGSRVLVAERPATVVPLAIRPPEPHPGMRVRPVMLPVKVNGPLKRA